MDVKEIPLLVFNEMTKEFRKGEEKIVKDSSREYRVRELKDGGFIAYTERPDTDHQSKTTHFEIWHHLPDDFYPYPEVLQIIAGPVSEGTWAYGSGNRINEDVFARFTSDRIYFRNPLMPVISEALLFAAEFALSPDCTRDKYWESEHCPKGEFSEPPE